MPAILCVDNMTNTGRDAGIYYTLPLGRTPDGEDEHPRDVNIERSQLGRLWDRIRPSSKEGAHVRAWMHNGSLFMCRPGDAILVDDDHYGFVSLKYPGMFQMTDATIRAAGEVERSLLRELDAVKGQLLRTQTERDDAVRDRESTMGRAQGSERAESAVGRANSEMQVELDRLRAENARLQKKQPAPAKTGTRPKGSPVADDKGPVVDDLEGDGDPVHLPPAES